MSGVQKTCTLLVYADTPFISRNFLRTEALPRLVAQGVKVVVLVPEVKRAYYEHEFLSLGIIFEALPKPESPRIEGFFKFVEAASIYTRTVELVQRSEFERDRQTMGGIMSLMKFLIRRTFSQCGHFRPWRRAIRRAYRMFRTREYGAVFDRWTPDAVFCSSMLLREFSFLREAKRRGVPSVGEVLSWDNLTSKTLLRVHPDRLLVHNDAIAADAVRYGDFPRERVEVIGMPQYDRYFKGVPKMSREAFFREIGGDASRELILYAISGKQGLGIDTEMLRILQGLMKEGRIARSPQVLIRPYPRTDYSDEKSAAMSKRFDFLTHSAVAHVGEGRDSWEFDEAAVDFLHASLAYSDVVVTMYSTFFLEAAILDKPTIAIAFDGTLERSRANSAERFFEWNHLVALKPLGGIRFVRSEHEFADALNDALEHPERGREGRSRIVARECQFLDGKSGERLANALTRFVEGAKSVRHNSI